MRDLFSVTAALFPVAAHPPWRMLLQSRTGAVLLRTLHHLHHIFSLEFRPIYSALVAFDGRERLGKHPHATFFFCRSLDL
jgi:hypothetical protein